MSQLTQQFEPGQYVAVTQQIPHRNKAWLVRVEGTVVRYEQKKTGSWFAHSKDDRLWLDRLVIRKSDGEIISLALDANTHIDHLPPEVPPEVPPEAPPEAPPEVPPNSPPDQTTQADEVGVAKVAE